MKISLKIPIPEIIVLAHFNLKIVLGAWVRFGFFGLVWWCFFVWLGFLFVLLKTSHIM